MAGGDDEMTNTCTRSGEVREGASMIYGKLLIVSMARKVDAYEVSRLPQRQWHSGAFLRLSDALSSSYNDRGGHKTQAHFVVLLSMEREPPTSMSGEVHRCLHLVEEASNVGAM